ncbi:ThuA domain-containing protein [Puia sp.]|jgi:cytochrome c|uniref:ThuA domain-containing protein n=1 Tax=Puia sp. TaxID=2045100 RepID=UPI002F4046AF
MKRLARHRLGILLLGLTICTIVCSYCDRSHSDRFAKPSVLIFCKTNGYHHASISTGIAAITKLGQENGFAVDSTTDSTRFREKNLKKYKTLIFLSPTGTVFGPEEEKALQAYIHQGGGFVGIHAAADCEYNWQWYGDLVGGYFKSHPRPQEAKFIIVDKDHPATQGLPNPWTHFDELYNYKYYAPDIKVLIKIDETSYSGGENGENHPMAWYHPFEGGRSFYTALGHTDEAWSDPMFLHHVLGGIQYAMGKK